MEQNYGWSTFSEQMEAGREYQASRRDRLAYLGPRIVNTRKPLRIIVGTREASAMLGVTDARIKALAAQRRILGARRKGRPWRIPCYLQPDGSYLPKLSPGERGAELKAAAKLGIARPSF